MAEITGQQFSTEYVLTSPTGYRAVFNNSSDGDYVGDLLGEDAVTGLDAPSLRTTFYENVQADGTLAPEFFATSRPVTFTFTLRGTSIGQRNDRAGKIRKVLADSLKADATLTWTPSSVGATREHRLRLRYTEPYREKGGWVKTGFFGMTASWPFIESSALATSAAIGSTNVTLANEGWSPAWPSEIVVTGASTNPALINTTTSRTLQLLGLVIGAGETIKVDMKNRVIHKGTPVPDPGSPDNLYAYINYPNSANFWFLQPGNNQVRLTGGGTMVVKWRHTWL
jgi:hypothetical protein